MRVLQRSEKQEGVYGLLLQGKQGGGVKERWHVLHHLFAQRLHSNSTLVPRFASELQFH